jgi:hypothetical protein
MMYRSLFSSPCSKHLQTNQLEAARVYPRDIFKYVEPFNNVPLLVEQSMEVVKVASQQQASLE